MEIDFGDLDFITACCFISPDQEDILESCAYLGELEVLYEEELLQSSGEQAAGSTGVFMASPADNTQVARNESVTPQETYHTPPEEAVPRSSSSVEVFGNGGCRDGERAVDLGRDDDVGIPERTERARGLERGPSSDDRPSKKPRLSGGNEGLRGSPAEGTKIMEVKLYVETQDAYEGVFKEKLKENLEKAVESLKVYGPMVLRGIRIHGGTLIQRKLNLTVKLDDAPTIVDLEVEESENVPEPGSSTGKGEADRLIGSDSAQMARGAEVRDVADVPNFTYERGKDLPFRDKGKAVAERHTIGIRGIEQLKAHAGDDRRGERSSEINVTVEDVQRLECDMGPKEAEMDCVRGVDSVENVEKLRGNSGKNTPVRNKGKAVTESEEVAIRRDENLRAPANDDREGQSSSIIDIQKDKDGSQHKQDGKDSLESVTDGEVIGVSRKNLRREVKNIEDLEKFRYNREKDPCLQDKEKAIAGQEQIHVSDGKRSKVQTRDDREGQIPMEIDCGIEHSQNMGVIDKKSRKSSDIDENLQTLPVCVHELAQHTPGRVKASSRLLKQLGIFNVLGKVAEACEGHDLEEGSVADFAKRLGITFPRPNS